MEPIRILLADDHTLFRRGIHTILDQMEDLEVVGEAARKPWYRPGNWYLTSY